MQQSQDFRVFRAHYVRCRVCLMYVCAFGVCAGKICSKKNNKKYIALQIAPHPTLPRDKAMHKKAKARLSVNRA